MGDEALLIDIEERNGEQVPIGNLASIAHQEIIFGCVEDVFGDGVGGEEQDAGGVEVGVEALRTLGGGQRRGGGVVEEERCGAVGGGASEDCRR